LVSPSTIIRLIATTNHVTAVNHQPLTPVFCWLTGARKKIRRVVRNPSPMIVAMRAYSPNPSEPRATRTVR
jgi:hypothetical protein